MILSFWLMNLDMSAFICLPSPGLGNQRKQYCKEEAVRFWIFVVVFVVDVEKTNDSPQMAEA